MQGAKCLSEEAIQIPKKRREANGEGEKERYIHLNADFKEEQGEIRKPSSVINAKKQRKRVEWERLQISLGKLRDSKGTFHTKMGTIKDRNSMDLTEVKEKRRGGKIHRTIQKGS